jgi:hypothetical protein
VSAVALSTKGKGKAGANLLLEQAVQLLFAVLDPEPVGGIYHPDEGVRLLKVVSPVGP